MRKVSLLVIGAGAGGLVVAIGAAKAGKKVLLIERSHWGGDCTNFGCIPSKALIASGHAAHAVRNGDLLGLVLENSSFHAANALERVRRIVREIRSHEEPDALTKNGVETLQAIARFIDANTIEAGENTIRADKIVIAAGSSPFIPPLPGLQDSPYLTNETIFDLKEVPRSMIVMGGGPIGCELAQAFQRLGTQVTLVHSHKELLAREEKAAQQLIAKAFTNEGISCSLGEKPEKVSYEGGKFTLFFSNKDPITAEALLVSVGRRPNLSQLNLEAAGVQYNEKGIITDDYGKTSQKHIFAIGDCVGPPFFTHRAEFEARSVLASLLLPFNKKIDKAQPIPRVTFTDPEIASIGLTEAQAKKKYRPGSLACYTIPFSLVDRAVAEGRTEGFIFFVTKKWSSRILGCTIAGPKAGEMLTQVSTAMLTKMPLRKFAGLIHPYPTYGQAIRKAADLWLTQTLLGAFRKKK